VKLRKCNTTVYTQLYSWYQKCWPESFFFLKVIFVFSLVSGNWLFHCRLRCYVFFSRGINKSHCKYSPQTTSWSPQGMQVLRQCKVPRAEVMFVTIQRESIRSSKKEMNKAWTCPIFAVRLWITTSPHRWPIGSFQSTCMLCTPPPPHCTKDVLHPAGMNSWSVQSRYLSFPEGIVLTVHLLNGLKWFSVFQKQRQRYANKLIWPEIK
jgi:hypothetical protein